MNTPLVKKIGKPVLILGIAVAMACLLFPFGATTNQAHAAAKDTPADLNDTISTINAQLTQTAQLLNGLDGDYYTQAVDDYNTFIIQNVINWLSNLANEVQNNGSLNSDPVNDQFLIKNVMSESDMLNAWATSISSGSGIEPLAEFKAAWDFHDRFISLGNAFGNYTSDCVQQIRTLEQVLQSGSPLSGQPMPLLRCHPAFPFSLPLQSSGGTSQPSDTPKTCFLGICF